MTRLEREMGVLRACVVAFALTFVLALAGCAPDAEEEAARDAARDGEVQRIGAMTLEGVPPLRAELHERLAPYNNTRAARFVDWLPRGGGMLVATRFADTVQLHVVAMPGGAREQLTFFAEPVAAASVRPIGGSPFGFVFVRDNAGAEDYQLYFMDWQSMQPRLLTDGTSRNSLARWSRSGAQFAYASTRRNGRDQDIYVGRHDGHVRAVSQRGGTWEVFDWSSEDTHLLVAQYVSVAEAYLFTLDVANGRLRRVWPAANVRASLGGARFARSGDGVFLTSDAGGEFERLHYVDVATGSARVLTEAIPWDIEAFDVSPAGGYAFVANVDGVSELHVRGERRDAVVAVPRIPVGVVGALRYSPDGDRLAFDVATPRAPRDVYAIDLATMRLERWTRSEVGGLDRATFVGAERVRVASFDRERIAAFVYRPRAEVHPGRRPVLIDVHGGPEAQSRPDFDARRQFFVEELGIAVVEPNVRGSTGYGKRFRDLDNGLEREDAIRDIGAVLEWIGTQPSFDARRVAIMGTSYGGYVALASLARHGPRLRAGIDVVGITNFVSFLDGTAPYRRALRRAEYGDDRDPVMRAFLEGISPLTLANRIVQPVLVAQGANDPRVPRAESEQMVRALRARDVPVWYALAEDEGHGFRKRDNRATFDAATALFLQRTLLDRPRARAR